MSKTRLIQIPRAPTGDPNPPTRGPVSGPPPGAPYGPPSGGAPYGPPAGPAPSPVPPPRPAYNPPAGPSYGSPPGTPYGGTPPGPFGSPPLGPTYGTPPGGPTYGTPPGSPTYGTPPGGPSYGAPVPPPPKPAPSPAPRPTMGPPSRRTGLRGAEGTRVGRAVGVGANASMAPMYWACADLLTLASQLAQGAVPSTAGQLRTNIATLFAGMRSKGAAAGIVPEELTDASYAIMALFDEILVQTNWPGRGEWQKSPLQFEHFHENTAGENFFRRAEAYAQQPHRVHVLQIYFICLGLGFQGRYAMGQPAELEAFTRRISAVVSAAALPSEILSPHGAPPDSDRSILKREAPIAALGVACLVLSLVVFCLLLLARTVQLSHALEPMRAYRNASTELPGKI